MKEVWAIHVEEGTATVAWFHIAILCFNASQRQSATRIPALSVITQPRYILQTAGKKDLPTSLFFFGFLH